MSVNLMSVKKTSRLFFICSLFISLEINASAFKKCDPSQSQLLSGFTSNAGELLKLKNNVPDSQSQKFFIENRHNTTVYSSAPAAGFEQNIELNAVVATSGGPAKLIFPSGQSVVLNPNSEIQIAETHQNNDGSVCSVSFNLISGEASFESDHEKLEKCKSPDENLYAETHTENAAYEPIGTRYSVDLKEEIAALNGEDYRQTDHSSVKEGRVLITLRRAAPVATVQKKNSRKLAAKGKAKVTKVAANKLKFKKGQKQKAVATYRVEEFETKKTTLKRYGRVKIKKGEKEKFAEIEVLSPGEE